MSKLEKYFSLDVGYPLGTENIRTGDEAIDIALLLQENRSLRDLAAEILLQSELLREGLRKQGTLH